MNDLTDHAVEMLECIRVFAELHGKPVEVDVDTVTKDRRVTVVGDFGNVWTHGGYAPLTRRQVAIDELSGMRIVAEEVDRREARRNDIPYALSNEPMSLETANELLGELGELEASVQADPPEFGSAEWFASIEPIAWC